MPEIIEVTTTTETHEQATQIARTLVEARLAACVQVTGPIQSIYRWQGAICETSEFRCTIKSCKRLTARLIDCIARHHPYETPEILITDITSGSSSYATWLDEQVDRLPQEG
jgi:periplasmic divalent cation tolerance protein